MCGIAGFFGEGTYSDLENMTSALTYRGPDDHGYFVENALHFGHRRLAILDLERGKQPVQDAQGLTLIYNGELYNHLELRKLLEVNGHKFISNNSDSETVLHAFAEWGVNCFQRFNGMFALAIYCPKRQKIWLARDRFGEKPLFYVKNKHGFAFASEIAALKYWPYFDSSLVESQIQRFFAWSYLPAKHTLHPDCYKVEPGHYLEFDCQSEQIKEKTYWEFCLNPDDQIGNNQELLLVEELRALIIQAVKRRLQSDVPLGIFLSGGIDSSTILAACSQILPADKIQAFSIGFKEKDFDESENAKLVAEYFEVKHHLSILTQEIMQAEAPQILASMSEPFGDASLIPTSKLASFAREKVTVALSGDGGDELFAGYDPIKALKPAARYRKYLPNFLHKFLTKSVNLLPASDRHMSLEFKLKRVLRGLNWRKEMQLPIWMSPLSPAEIADCFANPLSPEELYVDALNLWAKHPEYSDFEQALMFFTRFYLTDDILVKSDRASMRVSLESRAIFLDNDLVAFCQKLPQHFKYRKGIRKYLLKYAATEWLPSKILKLPKRGFGIPLNLWLRKMPSTTRQIPSLYPEKVAEYQKKHQARKGDCRLFLWALHSINHLIQQ